MIITSRINNTDYRQRTTLQNRVNFCGGPKLPQSLPVDVVQTGVQEQLHRYVNRYNYSIRKPLQWRAKRVFDYAAASAGIVATSPVMLATAIAIKLDSKGPVIFKQTRVGKDGKLFTFYKFRSMTVQESSPEIVSKVVGDKRVTRVGRVIRKFSLDELPQLFNVIKGDMSIIGPRPLAIADHNRFLKEDSNIVRRYSTMLGLTLGYPRRANATLSVRECADVEKSYLENWNIGKDIKHIFMAARDILSGRNM